MNNCEQIKTDCRYFRGYIPCKQHKIHSVHCDNCKWYEPIAKRILVIKLDAIGDVLRTTCVIPKIKELYPCSYITWIVKPAAIELLSSNPEIDDVWNYDDVSTLSRLSIQQWDYIYSLDNTHSGAALASIAEAKVKHGFILSQQGIITPTNKAAQNWLRMSTSDVIKKRNSQSYQKILYEICGFSSVIYKPMIYLSEDNLKWAKKFVDKLCKGRTKNSVIIGINTGSGTRWPNKMIDSEKIINIVRLLLANNPNNQILILGGPDERDKNRQITEGLKLENCHYSGCDHSLLRFSAIINECDVILCGDTLALHIATSLNVPSVVLFGPTSPTEIHDYDNLVHKVMGQMDCRCCYGQCDKIVNCMSVISVNEILKKIEKAIRCAQS